MENAENPNCLSNPCDWSMFGGGVGCGAGAGTCFTATLLEAEESEFHDSRLIEATRAIKEILAELPEDQNGRKLSFVHTKMGTLLAWVEHGGTVPDDAVTAKDDDATVAAALKLKNAK